jgi:uncharacterized protein YoaH (UPF0181 family)
MALQQIGTAASNEFTSALYYAPPPQQPMNVFAAFWSNFLKERTPWARQLFTARLKAMDPTAKLQALVDLEKEMTKRQQDRNDMIEAAMRQGGNLAGIIVQTEGSLANQASRAAIARMEAINAANIAANKLSTSQEEIARKMRPLVETLYTSTTEEGFSNEQYDTAVEQLTELMAQGEARGNTLMEKQAFRNMVSRELNRKFGYDNPNLRELKGTLGMTMDVPEDTPLPQVGVDRGAVRKALDTAMDYGVPLGRDESVRVRGPGVGATTTTTAAEPAAAPARVRYTGAPSTPAGGYMVGLLNDLQQAFPAATPLGVTRADIEAITDPSSTIGNIGDPAWTKERARTRRKRETLERASTPAGVAVAMGAEGAAKAAAEDPLLGFLRPGKLVADETRQSAETMASASGYKPPTVMVGDAEQEEREQEQEDQEDELDAFLPDDEEKRKLTVGISGGELGIGIPLPRLRKKKKPAEE